MSHGSPRSTRRRAGRTACRALVAACIVAWLAGCKKAEPPPPPAKPAEVTATLPRMLEFREHEQFTGRIAASETVEIRARVSGYLEKVDFRDGALVKAGDLLFAIDARPFQAEVARAEAVISQAQARFQRLGSQLERSKRLLASGAVTQDEHEILQSDLAESQAAIRSAQATRDLAQLDLAFTEVRAPVGGWISRRYVDAGNLVKSDDTLLATIVALDPVHAYFDVDERTVVRVRKLIHEGTIPSVLGSRIEIQLSLSEENAFPLSGVIDYAETSLDPNTGTMRLRASLENKDLLLSPGFFVRCRVPVGATRTGLTVPEEALGADQGQRFLYVVDAKDEVVYRRVKVGPLMDGRRVIESELEADERVIVSGLQRVRPGAKVAVKMTPAPETAASSPGEATAPVTSAQ